MRKGSSKRSGGGRSCSSRAANSEAMFIDRSSPGAAASSSIPAEFNKGVLVNRHDAFRAQLGAAIALHSGATLFLNFASPEDEAEHKRAVKSLSELQPILLKDMTVDQVHLGRVLYGTLVVCPFRMSGLITVLEDEAGYAMRLAIYELPIVAPESLFPRGSKVAIQEPYLRTCADGALAIRIDVPAHIIRVNTFPSHVTPASTAEGARLDFSAMEKLREQGNRHFSSKAWQKAIDSYTQCISGSSALDNPKARSEVLLPAFSNRAESWLRLGKLDRALSDANAALEIDNDHLKCLYRKGRALEGLQEHAAACEVLQRALEKSPSNVEIKDVLAKAQICQEQASSGKFDLSSFFLGGEPPVLSDYVGPVTIRHAARHCGGQQFGLFATRNVKMGEVIIVSNALAVLEGAIEQCTESIFNHSLEDVCDCLDVKDLIEPSMKKMASSRRFAAQMRALETGQAGEDLAMFKPNGGMVPADYSVPDGTPEGDPELLAYETVDRLVTSHSFIRTMEVGLLFDDAGLWVLPCMVRDSCLSNVRMVQCGSAVLVHAARDISSGEELTVPWFETLVPVALRSSLRGSRGSHCDCARCSLEKSLENELGGLSDKYSRIGRIRGFESMFGCNVELQRLRRLSLEVEGKITKDLHLSKKEQTWLRAGYLEAYMSAYDALPLLFSKDEHAAGGGRVLSAEEILDVLQACVPGHIRAAELVTAKARTLLRYGRRRGDPNIPDWIANADLYDVFTSVFGCQEPHVLQHLFLVCSFQGDGLNRSEEVLNMLLESS